MRILLLHNAYQHKGGEDTVVAAETGMLRNAGNDVVVNIVSNDSITGLVQKCKIAVGVLGDEAQAQRVASLVRTHRADIVHIHNFFPRLSPSVHGAARKAGAAVVQTLHNYRLLCAGALFLRNGKICEKCLGGSNLWGVAHRCYRGSVAGSASVAGMQSVSRAKGVWQKDVDAFIALTGFGRDLFVRGGLPSPKIHIKPNFLAKADTPEFNPQSGEYALYVGRLSPEKGVDDMVEAWAQLPNIPLKIIGDGPRRLELEARAPGNVAFLGALDHKLVLHEMANARVLVFPSIWYEGFPMTFAEAMASGLPIAAANIGAASEIVSVDVGRLFRPNDPADLAGTVQGLWDQDLSVMRFQARQKYERLYTDTVNLEKLKEIYQAALTNRWQ